jgi:hypothetical protein
MLPDHFNGMQMLLLLINAFIVGVGWNLGNWVATKIHK